MSEEIQAPATPSPSASASASAVQHHQQWNLPSFSIWPPNQKTRDAVIQRLVDTLSSPSVLSKRYGLMEPEDAMATARLIESQAFDAASALFSNEAEGGSDGIEILQNYSREISKLMLESVKSRSSSEKSLPQASEAKSEAAPADESAVVPME